MASRIDLAALALRVLEDALAEASHGPVQRTWGHRLALSWLRHAGLAEEWQCRSFWKLLAEANEGEANGKVGYVRQTLLNGFLTHCYHSAGLEVPSEVQRALWASQEAHGANEAQASRLE